MEITRNVILDVLPLYLAGEASADTQALVEHYLETDPEVAALVSQVDTITKREEIPLPRKLEDQMEAYKEAQKVILRKTVIWGAILAFALLSFLGLALMAYFMLVPVT
jgi:anti-sigma factor RsiW